MNPQRPSISLTQLKPGQRATVHTTSLDQDDAALLRAMGLRPNAAIRICRLGSPCIIEVNYGRKGEGCSDACWCRIGLAKPLAERVMVDLDS